ncbi:MAG: GNAT family N-acetyltransferase [archaeon]
MKDGKFELADISIVKLSKIHDLSKFDCADNDLNDFLKNDALTYQEKKLVTTTLLVYQEKVIGFFSMCSDSIRLQEEEKENCDIHKPLREYPAVKFARLAVDKEFQSKNLGKLIIKLVIGLVINEFSERVACRFITVDSYSNKVSFYQLFSFIENTDRHYKKDNYVSMRFDLLNPYN